MSIVARETPALEHTHRAEPSLESGASVPAPPGFPAPTDRLFRITNAMYHAMGEHGLIGKADRVVLLDGFLVKKMTKGVKHIYAVQKLVNLLNGPGFEGFYPRKEDPLALYQGPDGADSEPEPDVLLVRGTVEDYAGRLPGPGDIVLAVEVADSSLYLDRAGLVRYAWFGVPCVWIVNLVNSTVEVYDRPMGVGTSDARYGRSEVKAAGEEIAIEADGRVLGRVRVSDIIP